MTAWLLLYPGEGSAGWTAHWLDFDLVSQGRDAAHALQTALDAAGWLLRRRAPSVDPSRFRPAPPSEWARLERVLEGGGVVGDLSGLPTSLDARGARRIEAVAANYSIDLEAALAGPAAKSPPEDASIATPPFRPVVTFVLMGTPVAAGGDASGLV
jgi:hypothetical protein